jgi:hypothetical protein
VQKDILRIPRLATDSNGQHVALFDADNGGRLNLHEEAFRWTGGGDTGLDSSVERRVPFVADNLPEEAITGTTVPCFNKEL